MKRFLCKISLFFLPVMVLLMCYIIIDPFKVVWHYDNYRKTDSGASLNRGFVSAMTYKQQYGTYHYDSFIFGNSRSLFYQVDKWKKHLPDSAVCYHFSVSGGSIKGLYYAIKYIDDCGEKLNNALIVLDYQFLGRIDVQGPYHATPPVLTGYRNAFAFHGDILRNWLDLDFLRYWTEYQITGEFKDYMRKHIENNAGFVYDPVTNEESSRLNDSLIATGVFYNDNKVKEFANYQHPKVSPVLLTDEAKRILKGIRAILSRHNTSYRIVISPLYDQYSLNPEDEKTLFDIFGKANVFNFSGINHWTTDYHNYYEPSHYTPAVAAEIMDSIYREQSKKE